MNGDDLHIGELALLIKSTGAEGKEKKVWSVNKNLGEQWIHKAVTIYSMRPYQVSFDKVLSHLSVLALST